MMTTGLCLRCGATKQQFRVRTEITAAAAKVRGVTVVDLMRLTGLPKEVAEAAVKGKPMYTMLCPVCDRQHPLWPPQKREGGDTT